MKRLVLLASCALVAVAPRAAAEPAAPAPVPVRGDATDEARQHFSRGVEYFRDGVLDAALVQFRRAYAARPHFAVLYNIGQTALRLRDYVTALDAFERYLKDGGAEVAADRRAAVEEDLVKLRARVSPVTIVTSATRGEILVDDVSVAQLPLTAPVRMAAGRRKLTLVADGQAPVVRVLEIAGGEAVRVELGAGSPSTGAPPPAGAASVTPAPEPTPAPPAPATPRTAAWVALGTSGVLLASATLTGVLAFGAKADADQELDRYPGSRAAFDDARSRMKTLALVTDILGAGAVVAGGVSLFLFLRPDAQAAAATAARPIELRAGPRGFAVRSTF